MAFWSRKAPAESVAGLDVNASRARAVAGADGSTPAVLPLGDGDELPMALNLDRRAAEVGRGGLAVRRLLPHAHVGGFLAELGQPREWRCGRHRLDAAAAVALCLDRLRGPLAIARSVGLTVPAYLSGAQIAQLVVLMENARLPVVGTVPLPLALAATVLDETWATALVVDADDHALTCSVLICDGRQARLIASVGQPALGLRAWRDRLVDAAADRCVQVCRRDPRDSAAAEQALETDLDEALDGVRRSLPAKLTVRTAGWVQDLTLTSEELVRFTRPLARRAAEALRAARAEAHAAVAAAAVPDVLWATHAADRLPGLCDALMEELPERTKYRPLPIDDPPRAAFALAGRWQRGELRRGPLAAGVPLPNRPSPADGRAASG